MSNDSPCRSCGAPLTWAITEKGRRMPVDPDPHPEGTVQLLDPTVAGGPPRAFVLRDTLTGGLEEARANAVPLHRSHFATCPNAASHRKGGQR